MTKEALQIALEALTDFDYDKRIKAIEIIKEALETKDKPVAWEQFHEHMAGPNYVAPQRTWVGLTKEEINQGLLRSFYVLEKARAWRDGVAWAEEILKRKNT